MSVGQVIIKKGKYDSLQRKHPWIFSGAIKEVRGSQQEGDVVSVVGQKGEFFGFGHWQNGSIAVRMLTFVREDIDDDFFIRRITDAINFRKALGFGDSVSPQGNAWRLIFGEADQLPGLIVDIYSGVAVIQCHSSGFHRIRQKIAEYLKKILGDNLQAVYYKPKEQFANPEMLKGECLLGELPDQVIIEEYGSKFLIDVKEGQKTGFFIDQRENRNLLKSFSSGRKVLNMFCYSGGFSVTALQGGAEFVFSVDASASAIQLCEQNLKINGFDTSKNRCIVSDAVEFLEQDNNEWDIIVLDPPAYAKHVDSRHRAVKGYQRLNAVALSKIKKGGFVFTYSCSQVVDKRLFESTVMSSAIITGRHVRVVAELTHAPCHANNIAHPEGKYLKGLLLYVE